MERLTIEQEFEKFLKDNNIQVDEGTIMLGLMKIAFEAGWKIGYRDGQDS